MGNQQRWHISPEELRLLARVSGVELAPERLEHLAKQVSIVFQNIDQLNSTELHHIEPYLPHSPIYNSEMTRQISSKI